MYFYLILFFILLIYFIKFDISKFHAIGFNLKKMNFNNNIINYL